MQNKYIFNGGGWQYMGCETQVPSEAADAFAAGASILIQANCEMVFNEMRRHLQKAIAHRELTKV